MSLSLYIANRLYRTKGDKDRISTLGVNLASLGVMIGLCVMIVTVAIVFGFKKEIRNKVTGFGSHIQIVNLDSPQEGDASPVIADSALLRRLRSCPGVTHVQTVSQKTGILKTDTDFKGMMLKGVGADYDTTFISGYVVEGRLPDFSNEKDKNNIVVSNIIAKELGLKVGDKVFAYFFEGEVNMRRFVVGAIYETNMAQFDNTIVFVNKQTVDKLNNWNSRECSAIELSSQDFNNNETVADRVAELKPQKPDANGSFYGVYSIKELYGSIFEWLKLLDLNIWVILILMVCVCCFTMVSGLFILILEKTSTIGLLGALGARNRMLRSIFMYYGVFIVGRGLVMGNVLGLLLCFVQWKWHLFTLDAASYYVDHVPISFDLYAVLLLNLATLLICSLILIAPTMIVSRIKPVKALKFD